MRVYRVKMSALSVSVCFVSILCLLFLLYLLSGSSRELTPIITAHSTQPKHSKEADQLIQRQILASESTDMELRSTVRNLELIWLGSNIRSLLSLSFSRSK